MCREGQAEGCGLPTAEADTIERKALNPSTQYVVETSAADPALGPVNAPVTLVVFSDYQCPFCRHLHEVLTQLHELYPDRLRIVWKDLPLPMHSFARPAALLGRAAYARLGNDGFWKVNAEIYAQQPVLSELVLERIAHDFSLSWPVSTEGTPQLNQALDQARALNISSTPTSFLNGRPVVGSKPLALFVKLIDEQLKPKTE
jgi:protein-disulfide isomerase